MLDFLFLPGLPLKENIKFENFNWNYSKLQVKIALYRNLDIIKIIKLKCLVFNNNVQIV